MFEHKRLPVGEGGCDFHFLVAQVMLYDEGGVGLQLIGAFEFFRLLFLRYFAGVGKAFVHILYKRDFVVKAFKVYASVKT